MSSAKSLFNGSFPTQIQSNTRQGCRNRRQGYRQTTKVVAHFQVQCEGVQVERANERKTHVGLAEKESLSRKVGFNTKAFANH